MHKLTARMAGLVENAIASNPSRMVSVFDDHGIIVFASSNSKLLFGYDRDELIGHSINEFVGALEAAHLQLAIQDAILNGDSISPLRHIILKFGGTKCMHGPAQGFVDRATGQAFALAVGRPCEED